MKQKSKTIPLLTYIILSLFYLEILFRFTVYRGFVIAGLVIPILFSMVLSLVLYFIGSLFKPKVNHILSCIFLAVLGFFFSSQFIYYDFFKTFYSMFSASNMTQILISARIAIRVAQNIIWVILFFIPFVLAHIRRKVSHLKSRALLSGQPNNTSGYCSFFSSRCYLSGRQGTEFSI